MDVFVVGYPRSGTSWMAWLLSDILDSPIEKSDGPISYEDVGRKGPNRIRHMHPSPRSGGSDELVSGDKFLNIDRMSDNRLVHIIRDPRDVSVSNRYFFSLPNLMDAIVWMGGEGHEWSTGKPISQIFEEVHLDVKHEWVKQGWSTFVLSWERCPMEHSTVRYEELLHDTKGCLAELLQEFHFDVDEEPIAQAIARQAFNVKREQIGEDTTGNRLFGHKTQLRNLRKGISEDWKNHYRRCHAELAQEVFGDMMLKLGYIEDEQWWKEID